MQDALELLAIELMDKGTFSAYEQVFDHLPDTKADLHIFRYILAMFRNAHTCTNPFDKKVALIGGYAVVPYVAEQLGDEHIAEWRGSHDIDLILKGKSYEPSLLEDFVVTTNMKSLAHPHKRQVMLKNEIGQKDVELDLYYNSSGESAKLNIGSHCVNESFWNSTIQIPVFGIPITVPSLSELIKMKLAVKTASTSLPRQKDIYDIITLVGAAEKREVNTETLIEGYTSQEYFTLLKCMSFKDDPSFPDPLSRVPLKPTKSYCASIDECLRFYAGFKA